MKKILILFLILNINASADFIQKVQETHIRSLNTILFFASEDIISSGHFEFESYDIDLDNYFFPFSFPFESNNKYFDYYLGGSIGFSNYKQKNIDLNRGSYDDYNLHNYALKIGGGLQYYLSKNTDLKLGLFYNYSFLDGTYKSKKTLDKQNPEDALISSLLNDTQQYHTLEVSGAFTYRPNIYEYKPYITFSARHFSTHLDNEITSRSIIKSTITKLKVGVITPHVLDVFGLSLTLEPYASILNVSGDIEDNLNLETIYVIGNTFRLNAYPVTCWVEDLTSMKRDSMNWVKQITFDLNMIKGHNFKGFNISLGVKF